MHTHLIFSSKTPLPDQEGDKDNGEAQPHLLPLNMQHSARPVLVPGLSEEQGGCSGGDVTFTFTYRSHAVSAGLPHSGKPWVQYVNEQLILHLGIFYPPAM